MRWFHLGRGRNDRLHQRLRHRNDHVSGERRRRATADRRPDDHGQSPGRLHADRIYRHLVRKPDLVRVPVVQLHVGRLHPDLGGHQQRLRADHLGRRRHALRGDHRHKCRRHQLRRVEPNERRCRRSGGTREHRCARDHRDGRGRRHADGLERHLERKPDDLSVPVGALQQLRRRLRRDLRGASEHLRPHRFGCRSRDRRGGRRDERRRRQQLRRLETDERGRGVGDRQRRANDHRHPGRRPDTQGNDRPLLGHRSQVRLRVGEAVPARPTPAASGSAAPPARRT